MFCDNFGKCGSVIIILLLLWLPMNCRRSLNKICHFDKIMKLKISLIRQKEWLFCDLTPALRSDAMQSILASNINEKLH